MAQTTAQVTMACGKVEFSTNNSVWTDVSGQTQSVAGTEQTRNSGEAYTLDGDTALIGAGKRQPMELQFAIVYTETDAEVYERARTQFEVACGGDVYVRWTPRGTGEGYEQVTSAKGVMTSFTYPPLDASGGGPIMGGFNVKTPKVTTAVVAS